MKLLELEKNKIIHTNPCKYKEYIVNQNNDIYGKTTCNEGLCIYNKIDLLNDFSKAGQDLFAIYGKDIKIKSKDDYEIDFGDLYDFLSIPTFNNNIEKTTKSLIKLFKKYGLLGDIEESNNDYPLEYITVKGIRKIVNQLLLIYIVNTIRNGLEYLNNKKSDEVLDIVDKAITLVEFITNGNLKINLMNANIKEIGQYVIKAKSSLANFINRYNSLFDKTVKRNIQVDENTGNIIYNLCSTDLLQIVWETLVSILTIENTNKNILICIECGKIEEKTGKNQKRCLECRIKNNDSKRQYEEKKSLVSKIIKYDINKINDKALKLEVQKINGYTSNKIKCSSIKKLREILNKLKTSQLH